MKMHLVVAAALAALCSHAAFADPEADFWQQPKSFTRYGTPAKPAAADRIVRLGTGAQSISVGQGETVEFIAQGLSGSEQAFAWRFDGSPASNVVDLSKVAPMDFPARDVQVLVAPDSRHSGG